MQAFVVGCIVLSAVVVLAYLSGGEGALSLRTSRLWPKRVGGHARHGHCLGHDSHLDT